MDLTIKFQLFLNLLLISVMSTGRVEARISADCPSNTVEIVFTKNGVICATTSSVPELNHLSVDPKLLPDLLGEPPIVHKMSLPLVTHPIAAHPPPEHLIVQQIAVPNMNQIYPVIAQPYQTQPVLLQPSVNTEFMSRRLPLYHENIINQNFVDRRPDLMEDKRAYYQKMLWDKLRRDAIVKKLMKNYPDQLFGIEYLGSSDQIRSSPDVSAELQTQQNSFESQRNNVNIEKIEKPSSVEPTTYEKASNIDENVNHENQNQNNNENNENISQESIDSVENTNQRALKNYLSYLQKSDSNSNEESNEDNIRSGRQYNLGGATKTSEVPDIVRGYMPSAPAITNGHTLGGWHKPKPKLDYSIDEPMTSSSQLSYTVDSPVGRQYNHKSIKSFGLPQTLTNNNNKDLRLVGTEMSFGIRINPKDTEYGFKNVPNFEENKKLIEMKNRFTEQQFNANRNPYEDDVVLVTADPNQRQYIERLEAEHQKSRRTQKQINDEWTGIQSFLENNSIDFQLNKDFRLDESKIEYNGWKPIRDSDKQIKSEPELKEEEMSASEIVRSILPITGRANHKWKAI